MKEIFKNFQPIWDEIEDNFDWKSAHEYEVKHNIKRYHMGKDKPSVSTIDEMKLSAMSSSISAYISKSSISGGGFSCDCRRGRIVLSYDISYSTIL